MAFRDWLVGPWAMMYSSPSEFRLEGRRYLKMVPATLKFCGWSMAELPLKKKCPDSSASASKREKTDKGDVLQNSGTEESKEAMDEKSPAETEPQALPIANLGSRHLSCHWRCGSLGFWRGEAPMCYPGGNALSSSVTAQVGVHRASSHLPGS